MLLRLNDLFDVLNSRNRLEKCANKRAISQRKPTTEEHHLQLLREADDWLGRWIVGDGSVKIDSLAGLRQTIRGVQSLWDHCKQVGCSVLCTRRLNQDALENLFGTIRQRGGQHDHPDPTQFRHSYKHAVLNGLMTAPGTANCEADGDSLVAALGVMTRSSACQISDSASASTSERQTDGGLTMLDAVTENCISYVAGYLNHKSHRGCAVCQDALVKGNNVATMASETLTALKSHTSLTCLDVGSLNLPTPAFMEFVKLCYVTFSVRARSLVLSSGIAKSLVEVILASRQAAALRADMCHPVLLRTMAATYTRLMLHSLAQRLTREGVTRGQGRKSRKLAKVR